MATHEFPTDRVHFTWDAGNEPVLTIESGDTVVYETRDVSDNQITPDSTAEASAGEYDLSREDAYVLSSLAVDLRISEVVDAGHYIVSALLPLAVFAPRG